MHFLIVASFVELVKYLFTVRGVKMFTSEHLNQDPLESFFGKQEQKGGGSDNPTVAQFINTTSSLRAQGSVSIHPLRVSCPDLKVKDLWHQQMKSSFKRYT